MNIILTGMRGTGKSVIGKVLAEKTGRNFMDMDPMIEQKAGMKIKEIVKMYGWEKFRALEHELAQILGESDNLVISTGGGTLMFERNVTALKRNGFAVLLTCDLDISARRIHGDGNRPSLSGIKSAPAELQDIWRERKKRYFAVADVSYDTSKCLPIGTDADEIYKLLKEKLHDAI